ncbi:hypothetical protein JHN49_00440 [Streptomyces sp. MBT57]|nr:hypothetical protein [Streptomyces sp. MBT57]
MNALVTQGDSDKPAPDLHTTYDLIICHQDRIVFHDHYEAPEQRLRMCVGILTNSDVLADTITATRAAQIRDLHNAYIAQRQNGPQEIGAARDEVVDALAKLCREWGVQLYVSTTAKKSAAPERLYSVITEYAPGQVVAEHFAARASRTASLVERAEHFFASPGHIPAIVLTDELRLAALVSMFLMPATVTLTESVLDADEGVYRPDSNTAPIR